MSSDATPSSPPAAPTSPTSEARTTPLDTEPSLEVGERAVHPIEKATGAHGGTAPDIQATSHSPAVATPAVAPPERPDTSASLPSATVTPEDLARQLANFRVEAPAPRAAHLGAPARAVERQEEEVEEEWALKSIAWPPLPPTPLESGAGETVQAHGFETDERLRVRIVCQNANGPCSLIALCNILVLRGDLHIAPGRTSVTYSYLSNALADYFLRATTSATAQSSGQELSLEAALSILPQTRYGLNLNPRFDRIDGFASSSPSKGELALFALARIPLLHGWLADPADPETCAALVGADGCQDYDTALERVVEGAEIAGGAGRLEVREGELSDEALIEEAERRSRWSEDEAGKVRRAYLINNFLASTSTQLTYPGLSALCTTSSLLPPSGLAALFRNSHLSVIYRRPTLPSFVTGAGPELFTLVTDSAFVGEAGIVWESLEDVDGSECAFFDGALRRSSVRGGDWVGSGAGNGNGERREEPRAQEGAHDAADVALAQQLQAEEDAHERRLLDRARAEEDNRRNVPAPAPVPLPPARSSAPAGPAERADAPGSAPGAAGGRSSRGGEGAAKKLSRVSGGSRKKEDKDKCVVM